MRECSTYVSRRLIFFVLFLLLNIRWISWRLLAAENDYFELFGIAGRGVSFACFCSYMSSIVNVKLTVYRLSVISYCNIIKEVN